MKHVRQVLSTIHIQFIPEIHILDGTPEERARLLEAANYFDSPAFFDPLAKNVDAIRTRHANQHIPMVTGALRSFRGNNLPYYYNLAQNFWTMI